MKKQVLVSVDRGETRVALLEATGTVAATTKSSSSRRRRKPANPAAGYRVAELYLERRGNRSIVGNIYKGKVDNVLAGLEAAFVDIGMDRAGFLGAREARCLADLPGFEEERAPKISECVHEGEEIMVQVVKDPIGEKGARLSANVTIPGRLAVLVPNQSGIALSRRIEGDDERARMIAMGEAMIAEGGDRLVPGAGYILRTAATEATLSRPSSGR